MVTQQSKMVRNLIADILSDPASTERARENSFRDFHCVGMDYVNLHRSDNLTLKLYVTYPDRLQPAMGAAGIVQPHTHGYNFHTHVLRGGMANIIFSEGHPSRPPGEPWREIRYVTPLNGKRSAEIHNDRAWLKTVEINPVPRHSGYYLNHEQIHTITVADDLNILLLHQYRDQPKPHTRLFIHGDVPDTTQLYKRFDRDEFAKTLLFLFDEVERD